MAARSDYIAVFDSGVGGISVLRELVKLMPDEKYLYFGDSANAPYGGRSTEEVRELTLAAAEYLISRGTKALVLACNTATSAAAACLREKYPDLAVVGIEPALKPAAERFPKGCVGVMATEVTLREEKFSALVERFPGVRVESIPAPGLVPLIEAGKKDHPQTLELLQTVLTPYKGKLDALVLGCTHYPFVRRAVAAVLGPEVALFDGGEGTARQTKRLLEAADLLYNGPGEIRIENSCGKAQTYALCHELLQEEAHYG